MYFCNRERVRDAFAGKTVALVGSGPGALSNPHSLIESHDVVVRVNNYKLFPATGYRTDVHYSFYGTSIRKTAPELARDGVRLCICKCPDARFMESEWHRIRGKENGIDFRSIYERRSNFWFCDTYVPSVEEFIAQFDLLGKHVPTTGFSALLTILECLPKHVYMTGFDFFSSGVHNVNEKWRMGDPSDPIGHDPKGERDWLNANLGNYPITVDAALQNALTSNLVGKSGGVPVKDARGIALTAQQMRRGVRL